MQEVSRTTIKFYINYEECKLDLKSIPVLELPGFILTMRNVNAGIVPKTLAFV